MSAVRFIMCADPLRREVVDSAFMAEYGAARTAGFDVALASYEALVDGGDATRAVRRVAPNADPDDLAIFRGWMLRPATYAALFAALSERGLTLINTPDAYRYCHELPQSYPVTQAHTPRTIWLPGGRGIEFATIMEALRVFGDRPVIVKDYVKSQKHAWDEACFIPSAADEAAVARVVGRFLELQGDDLLGGLVFREYVAFQPLTTHSRSGMPLTREYRLFFLDGQRLIASTYWEEGDYTGGSKPPGDLFTEVAQQVPSRFFTMDVAQRVDGIWMIVELGDGQVAGLPPSIAPETFYHTLAAHLSGSNATAHTEGASGAESGQ